MNPGVPQPALSEQPVRPYVEVSIMTPEQSAQRWFGFWRLKEPVPSDEDMEQMVNGLKITTLCTGKY